MKLGQIGMTVFQYAIISFSIVAIFAFWSIVYGISWGKENKPAMAMAQNFNYAYVIGNDGKFNKIKIAAWKHQRDSNTIQIVNTNGVQIYTHLSNVKLVYDENE